MSEASKQAVKCRDQMFLSEMVYLEPNPFEFHQDESSLVEDVFAMQLGARTVVLSAAHHSLNS